MLRAGAANRHEPIPHRSSEDDQNVDPNQSWLGSLADSADLLQRRATPGLSSALVLGTYRARPGVDSADVPG